MVFGEPAGYDIQHLESRCLLAVSMGADGWTAITPSADTRVVYVSSSTGDDANSGLSADAPLKSIWKGRALLRDGFPDWLLLKRGDVFTNTSLGGWSDFGGRSAQEPILISAYGQGDRPLLRTGAEYAFSKANGAVSHLAIVGLHFHAHTRDPDSPDFAGTAGKPGLRWIGPGADLLIEDVVFDGYASNLVFDAAESDPVRDVRIRRSVIVDAYAVDAHAQGLYASGVTGLLLEENVFDHNGWDTRIPGAEPTVFNHNAYVASASRDLVARGNVFARASSHGLQARPGGVVEGNLFLDNPIGMSYGLVNGVAVTPGGVSGQVSGNVFLGGRDINGSARGTAIDISNTRPGGGTVVRDNVIAHDTQGKYTAINLTVGSNTTNPEAAVGVNDLTIEGNLVYKWFGGVGVAWNLLAGGSGAGAINDVVIRDNSFQQLFSRAISHDPAFSPLTPTFEDNRYDSTAPAGSWFRVAGTSLSLEAWRTLAEPTAISEAVSYPDPDRNPGTYNAALGGAGTTDAFLAAARRQSAADWRPAYATRAIVDYIRAGFGLAPVVPDTTGPQVAMTYGGSVRMIRSTSLSPKTGYRFTVVYADDGILNAGTLKTGNLLISGPNGYNQLPSFVSSTTRSDGSILAEYRFNPPGGAWDTGDNALYKLQLGPDAVKDLAGNETHTGSLGTIIVYLTEAAEQPLTTIGLNATAVTQSTVIESTSSYTFKVTYLPHEFAMRSGSIGDGDIVVTNDNGYKGTARLVSKKRGSKPGSIVAKYSIEPPGGTWNASDSMTYTVSLRSREVRDVEGHYVPAGKLGRFQVSLASGGQVVITPVPLGTTNSLLAVTTYSGATAGLFNSEKSILAAA